MAELKSTVIAGSLSAERINQAGKSLDSKYGNSLGISGKTISLKNASNSTLSSITLPTSAFTTQTVSGTATYESVTGLTLSTSNTASGITFTPKATDVSRRGKCTAAGWTAADTIPGDNSGTLTGSAQYVTAVEVPSSKTLGSMTIYGTLSNLTMGPTGIISTASRLQVSTLTTELLVTNTSNGSNSVIFTNGGLVRVINGGQVKLGNENESTSAKTIYSLDIVGSPNYKTTVTTLTNASYGQIATFENAGAIGTFGGAGNITTLGGSGTIGTFSRTGAITTYTGTGTITRMTGTRTLSSLGSNAANAAGTLNITNNGGSSSSYTSSAGTITVTNNGTAYNTGNITVTNNGSTKTGYVTVVTNNANGLVTVNETNGAANVGLNKANGIITVAKNIGNVIVGKNQADGNVNINENVGTVYIHADTGTTNYVGWKISKDSDGNLTFTSSEM